MKTQWCSRHESAISPVLKWQPAFCRCLNACKDQGGCTNAPSPVQLVVNYPCRSRYTGPKADGLHYTQHAVAGPAFGIECLDCGSVKSLALQIGRALQVGCDATDAGVRSEDFDRWLGPLLTGIADRSPRVEPADSSAAAVMAETEPWTCCVMVNWYFLMLSRVLDCYCNLTSRAIARSRRCAAEFWPRRVGSPERTLVLGPNTPTHSCTQLLLYRLWKKSQKRLDHALKCSQLVGEGLNGRYSIGSSRPALV